MATASLVILATLVGLAGLYGLGMMIRGFVRRGGTALSTSPGAGSVVLPERLGTLEDEPLSCHDDGF